jgi:CheY-like chemotaxis protein
MTKSLASHIVLFVDDEKSILGALKREMLDEEYQCLFALSGNQALQIMQKEKVSVIVSDMKMPEMDGLRLLKLVRDKYPSTARIVLSGYTQLPQILVTINQAEVFKFLTKPWGDELKSVIREAIDYHQMQEDRAAIQQLLNLQADNCGGILSKLENIVAATKSVRAIHSALGAKALETAAGALDSPDRGAARLQLEQAALLLREISQADFEEYREISAGSFCEKLSAVLAESRMGRVEIEPGEASDGTVKTLPRMLSRFAVAAIRAMTSGPRDFLIRLRPNIVAAGSGRSLELTCLVSTDSPDMPDDGYDAQRAWLDTLSAYMPAALAPVGGGFQGLIAKGVVIMKIVVRDNGSPE